MELVYTIGIFTWLWLACGNERRKPLEPYQIRGLALAIKKFAEEAPNDSVENIVAKLARGDMIGVLGLDGNLDFIYNSPNGL